jgi:hypothetical protein
VVAPVQGTNDIPMIRHHRAPELPPIFQPSTKAGTSSSPFDPTKERGDHVNSNVLSPWYGRYRGEALEQVDSKILVHVRAAQIVVSRSGHRSPPSPIQR